MLPEMQMKPRQLCWLFDARKEGIHVDDKLADIT